MNIPADRSAAEAERGGRVIDLITLWLPPGVEPDVEEMMRIIDESADERAPADPWQPGPQRQCRLRSERPRWAGALPFIEPAQGATPASLAPTTRRQYGFG